MPNLIHLDFLTVPLRNFTVGLTEQTPERTEETRDQSPPPTEPMEEMITTGEKATGQEEQMAKPMAQRSDLSERTRQVLEHTTVRTIETVDLKEQAADLKQLTA